MSETSTPLTDTSSNQDSNLDVENIFGRRTKGTIDANGGKTDRVRINLDEITTGGAGFLVLLRTFDRGRRHGSDDTWTSTKTFTKLACPVTNLSDVDGNIGILGSRSDGELEDG